MTDEMPIGWDVDRTLDEIQALLPPGWAFRFEPHLRGFWVAEFYDKSKALLWEDANPAANLLLFDAYGWIKERVQPRKTPGPGSNWVRRRELTVQQVSAEALQRSRLPDPPDLDPNEVASVYDSHRHKPRR